MWWHTSWTISFISWFAALKSSGLVLFNKRDSVYKNRTGRRWGREKKEEESFVKPQSLNDFDRRFILKRCYGSKAFGKWQRLSILRKHTKHLFLMVAYLWLLLILKDGTWCFGWRWWRRAVIGKNRILLDNSCKSGRAHSSLLLYQLPSDIYYIHFIYVHCIHACVQTLRPLWHKEKENRQWIWH